MSTTPTPVTSTPTSRKKKRGKRGVATPTVQSGLTAALAAARAQADGLRGEIVTALEQGEMDRPMRDMAALEQLNGFINQLERTQQDWVGLAKGLRRTRSATPAKGRNAKSVRKQITTAPVKTKTVTAGKSSTDPVTPYRTLEDAIVGVLADTPGHRAAAHVVIAGVGERLDGQFTPADLRPLGLYPTRWMAACHAAKAQLVKRGLVAKVRRGGHGTWVLTDAGLAAHASHS